jgi:uncharacterized membrane protein
VHAFINIITSYNLGEKLDLLTIGGITLDQIFKVSRLPEKHFEAEVIEFGTFFGGRAPNVAAMAAKIGLKTGIVSRTFTHIPDLVFISILSQLTLTFKK